MRRREFGKEKASGHSAGCFDFKGFSVHFSQQALYQYSNEGEGDVIPKTAGWEDSRLAEALRSNRWAAQATDITRQTWDLLRKKRQAAMHHREAFRQEKHEQWYDLLIQQTDCATGDYESFARAFSRYLVVARK